MTHLNPQSFAAPAQAGPEPVDHSIDPAADRVGGIIGEHYDQLRDAAPEQSGELHFALPACDLTVRYVGEALANVLTAAFAHRVSEGPGKATMQLEWRIGDSSLAGGFPELPHPPRPLHPLGSMHRDEANNLLVERRRGFATILDAKRLQLTTVADGLQSVDTDLAAKPLLRFLLSLLLRQNVVLCHAALVGGHERGLLVTGQGGVGKSTIAAAAIVAGAGFCSDDFVALEWRDGQLIGHCLYATLMLAEQQMPRFPSLARQAMQLRADTFGKYLVALPRRFGGQVRQALSVDGVAVPRIVPGSASQLLPGKRSAMLLAIMPSTIIASPWREAERTRFLFDRVATLEPLIYQSGSDFAAIAEPLRERYGF
jgi:hypothetical protein